MKDIIRYRTVVNDGCVWPWEDMPEVQPATLTGLFEYLKNTCGINPEPLVQEAMWSMPFSSASGGGCVVRYGMRKQFYIPADPTQEELDKMADWAVPPKNVLCPICGGPLLFTTRMQAGTLEEDHVAACESCEIAFSSYSGIAWTAKQMGDKLTGKHGTKNLQRAVIRPNKQGGHFNIQFLGVDFEGALKPGIKVESSCIVIDAYVNNRQELLLLAEEIFEKHKHLLKT